MSDDQTLPDPTTTEPTPEPKPEPAKPAAPAAEDSHAGFAVYDLTLTRFVGGVAKTKKAAEAAVDKLEGHKYETRKV